MIFCHRFDPSHSFSHRLCVILQPNDTCIILHLLCHDACSPTIAISGNPGIPGTPVEHAPFAPATWSLVHSRHVSPPMHLYVDPISGPGSATHQVCCPECADSIRSDLSFNQTRIRSSQTPSSRTSLLIKRWSTSKAPEDPKDPKESDSKK